MIDVFYKSNSNNMNFIKLFKIIIVVLLVLFIGLMPAFRVYAMSLEATLIGALAGTALATALGTVGVAAVVAILIGMGFSCTVSMLYDYFNDPDNVSDFMSAWNDFTANHTLGYDGHEAVSMSGLTFMALYDIVKAKIVNHFETTVTPDLNGNYPLLNAMNVDFKPAGDGVNGTFTRYLNSLELGTYKWHVLPGASTTIQMNNNITGWQSVFTLQNIYDPNAYNNLSVCFTYQDSNYHLKFVGMPHPRWAYDYSTLWYPMVYNNVLYFCNGFTNEAGDTEYKDWYHTGESFNTNSPLIAVYFTQDDLPSVSSTDMRIQVWDNSNAVYTDLNGNTHYLAVKLPDGTVIDRFYYSGGLLYYLLCTECELIDTTDNVSMGNSIGASTTTVNEYYTTTNDVYYNYYNDISAANTAGTLATGTDADVKISTSALTSSVAATDVISDVAAVTDVQSAVQTTSGETISFSPSVTCMSGINMVRGAAGNITTRFPFAVVYVLRDAFNIFLAEPVTPSFSIPLRFNIAQLISIDEDFNVNLDNLNTIAAIARWGEAGAFAIVLAILTKRMLF